MKKIGKKLSFLTKIMLVIGLIISNLSSLSVVFAYEASDAVAIVLNDEKVLEISYTDELDEEVKAVDVKVYETYTYEGGLSEEEVTNVYSLTEEELLAANAGTLELTYDSIFVNEEEILNNFELFDGTYSVRVELVDKTIYEEEENIANLVLAYNTYEEKMTHDSGLNIKLFNSNNEEITQVNGKYPVTRGNSKVTVVAQIMSGGLNPNDVFVYENQEYRASELVALEFSSEIDFAGYLYGDYEVPVKVGVLKQVLVEGEEEPITEDFVLEDSIKVLYESYALNTEVLNSELEQKGYDDVYLFYGEGKDGLLYVLPEFETSSSENTVVTRTMLDLYDFFNNLVGEEEDTLIKFELLKNGENVVEGFVPATEEDTLESYLAGLTIDDTVKVVLTCKELTITYTVVVTGDLNDDNLITQDDVLILIDQYVGETEVTNIEHSDLFGNDDKVTSLDVLYLNQVVKTQVWETLVTEEEVTLNSKLEVKFNDVELNEENYLTSGDEFTVEYVLSLSNYDVNSFAGLFSYDETLFELVSIKVANEWIGNDENGKFIYLGNESLRAPELSEEEIVDEEVTTAVDYVMLTATFKALRATLEDGNDVITLEDIELFNTTENGIVNYVLDLDTVSTDVITVTASDDNTLSYLEIAGQKIELVDGIYEYELTVGSDVTSVDLKYILSNEAAKVTSTVYPEELVEGSNSVVITIESESGISQTYTVVVIREEVVEETTTKVNYGNYYDNEQENDSEVIVTPGEETEEPKKEEEESNLSKIIIIILILLVIAGLVYLIFKDDEDEETKKANKDVNRLKKENLEPEIEVKKVAKAVPKATTSNTKAKTKTSTKSSTSTSKTSGSKSKTTNNKKER